MLVPFVMCSSLAKTSSSGDSWAIELDSSERGLEQGLFFFLKNAHRGFFTQPAHLLLACNERPREKSGQIMP